MGKDKKLSAVLEKNQVLKEETKLRLKEQAQLFNTEEWIDGECRGNIGESLIRCNNVLYVRDAEGVKEV